MHTFSHKELIISITGAFIGTLLASGISNTLLQAEGFSLILASTGASAVLLFAAPHSPLSKPWNLVGGHVVSAIVGVSCYLLIPNSLWAASLSIPLSILAMHYTHSMHPPGGATAITAVVGGHEVYVLGYSFVVIPVLLNALVLLSIAISVAPMRSANPFKIEKK